MKDKRQSPEARLDCPVSVSHQRRPHGTPSLIHRILSPLDVTRRLQRRLARPRSERGLTPSSDLAADPNSAPYVPPFPAVLSPVADSPLLTATSMSRPSAVSNSSHRPLNPSALTTSRSKTIPLSPPVRTQLLQITRLPVPADSTSRQSLIRSSTATTAPKFTRRPRPEHRRQTDRETDRQTDRLRSAAGPGRVRPASRT